MSTTPHILQVFPDVKDLGEALKGKLRGGEGCRVRLRNDTCFSRCATFPSQKIAMYMTFFLLGQHINYVFPPVALRGYS